MKLLLHSPSYPNCGPDSNILTSPMPNSVSDKEGTSSLQIFGMSDAHERQDLVTNDESVQI